MFIKDACCPIIVTYNKKIIRYKMKLTEMGPIYGQWKLYKQIVKIKKQKIVSLDLYIINILSINMLPTFL